MTEPPVAPDPQQPAALHIVSPLLDAPELARRHGIKHLFVKNEVVQPSGSFKIRGIGYHIARQLALHPELKQVVSSSGGNAGMAATVAARKLGLTAVVFVPTTTPLTMAQRIEAAGAQVIVAGNVWDEAHASATEHVSKQPPGTALLVHPFEGADIWEGHSTIIDEISRQLPRGVVPDAVVCVVGGGGLLSGIIRGLERCYSAQQQRPIVVAVETAGADSYAAAIAAGGDKPVALTGITSIAKTLGALQVSPEALAARTRYGQRNVRSLVVTDRQAVAAAIAFADDFRLLVEASCGAGLALAYGPDELLRVVPELTPDSCVVFIGCGGALVSLDVINAWKTTFEL
ncbi:hypothetical protein HDU87_001215 [Geranomyces variabilis]|uniref:L-serine ammonia-lyase n=1 Tax=Geranomyces variabilis TaxID=109894 RepID=A0AAD5XNH2_9FUNG|nr:hypothetical protein HDU87_001215 [Geranomyces variabilis]